MKDFSMKNKMLQTPYMVLLAVLLVVGLGTVYAATEYIQMDGSYNITGDLLVNGNLTGPTITEFDKRITLLEFTSSTNVTTSNKTDTNAIYDLEDSLSEIESSLNMTNTDS